jgi:DNA adenine methylase
MSYPGGKSGSGIYQTIINQMPPHRIYVEAFLGGGAILRTKRPASSSIGIDSDGDVITAFPGDAAPALTLVCGDAISYLAEQALSLDTLVYCDPPYLMETRRQKRQIYRCELERFQHEQLLEVIQRLNCMVMISGYYSDLYAQALADWRSIHFQARTRGGRMATEWLWMNFPPPLELHDYRYLGRNFRERERIKRKQRRWKNRLEVMPDLERYAMLSVIQDFRSATS